MGIEDVCAVRGLVALATQADLPLGPFASVAALHCEYVSVVLHLPGCAYQPRIGGGYQGPVPVTATDLAVLPALTDRHLTQVSRLHLAALDWCATCAPADHSSDDPDQVARAAWLGLVALLGELADLARILDPLVQAAGADRTWPRSSRLRGRAAVKARAHAEQLATLVETYRLHPCTPAAVDRDTNRWWTLVEAHAARLAQRDTDGRHGAQLQPALDWARGLLTAQREHAQALLESFPVHRLLEQPTEPGEDVLVLTYAGAPDGTWAARQRLAVETLTQPVFAADDVVVLRMPAALVAQLRTRPLGQAPVPPVDNAHLARVAQVAAAAATGQLPNLARRPALFADLVAAAVTAAA